jgi:hypothetical protein
MKKKLDNTTEPQHDAKLPVSGSVCEHKNQQRIDYGTNICKDCRRLILTLKQSDR